MASIQATAEHARRHAAHGARNSDAIEKAARFGYAAKGVVYIIVGVLACLAAFGMGGEVGNSNNALERIVEQPHGKFLLAVVGVGLLGYAVWKFMQSFVDVEEVGTGKKAIAQRIGWGVSTVIHIMLAVHAGMLVLGQGGGGGGNREGDWVAQVMDAPAGLWIVGLIGAAIIGGGIAQWVIAFRGKFLRQLDLGHAGQWQSKVARFSGYLGFAARGVVFILIGWFVIQAALNHDPGRATGLSGALRSLGESGYGPWLLGLVAFGLAAYGVFCIVQAIYRRIPAPH